MLGLVGYRDKGEKNGARTLCGVRFCAVYAARGEGMLAAFSAKRAAKYLQKRHVRYAVFPKDYPYGPIGLYSCPTGSPCGWRQSDPRVVVSLLPNAWHTRNCVGWDSEWRSCGQRMMSTVCWRSCDGGYRISYRISYQIRRDRHKKAVSGLPGPA